MHRKLIAIAAGVGAGLMVLSALAQTPPPKKKHKKKHKPAATAVDAGAPASIELDTPAPAGSASAGATPAAAEEEEDAGAPGAAAAASEPESAGPGGAHPWSVGALVGWGFNGGAKLGFGVRGGYTLPMDLGPGHLYLGATFIYHLGESEYGGTANFFYPGVEGGYELSLGPVLVRPYLGLGPLILHETLPPITVAGVTNAQGSNSTTYFAVWPGVTGMYPVTPMFFVGADLRYVILSDFSHLAAFLTGGARF